MATKLDADWISRFTLCWRSNQGTSMRLWATSLPRRGVGYLGVGHPGVGYAGEGSTPKGEGGWYASYWNACFNESTVGITWI